MDESVELVLGFSAGISFHTGGVASLHQNIKRRADIYLRRPQIKPWSDLEELVEPFIS